MSDHVPTNMQEMPWEYDLNCDLDEWIDWSLHDSIPDDPNWADSMDLVNWDAGIPDASGSLGEGPIRSNMFALKMVPSFSCPIGTPFADVPSADQDVQIVLDDPAQLLPDVERVSKTCSIRGCNHKRTFKGAYELKRHVRTVHGDNCEKPFTCGAQGCFKGTSPPRFVRSDKLTAHIKAAHKPSTVFAKCPVTDCDFGPSTLETLGVHIQRRHDGKQQGSAVLHATSCKVVKCPLWRCGKHMPAKKLLQHFEDHSIDEITANMADLKSESLLVKVGADCGVAVQIVCPVCKTATDCIEQFKKHVSVDHLWKIRESAAEHFEEWQGCLLQILRKTSHPKISRSTPWSRLEISRWEYIDKAVSCPACTFAVDSKDKLSREDLSERDRALVSTHHLDLLRPDAEVVSELFPHRMQILRFWPEFVTHPVFADFDQLPKSNNDYVSEQLKLA